MPTCACTCGGDVGPNRVSASRAKIGRIHPSIGTKRVVRFLPGHNTRLRGGYGRTPNWRAS